MNIKFNWGTGILITIIIFIGIMVSIIVFSMNQQVNLVSPDYYPKGVNHEKQLEKSRNLALLKSKVTYIENSDSLNIIFPKDFKNKIITGTVQFYYIVDFEKDINRKIELDPSLKQSFLLSQFETGRYIIKLDWSDGKRAYYQEIDINL